MLVLLEVDKDDAEELLVVEAADALVLFAARDVEVVADVLRSKMTLVKCCTQRSLSVSEGA